MTSNPRDWRDGPPTPLPEQRPRSLAWRIRSELIIKLAGGNPVVLNVSVHGRDYGIYRNDLGEHGLLANNAFMTGGVTPPPRPSLLIAVSSTGPAR